MSTQLSLRDSFERERRRVRERRAAQYTAAKRARAERGIGSVGLPDDVLEEVVLLSCVRTVGRLRAASVEFKDAVEAHEGVLWPKLAEARFPTAVRVAELCRSPPRSSEEWITLYRRQLAFMANSAEVEAEAAPDASDLSRYVFSLEAFAHTPSGRYHDHTDTHAFQPIPTGESLVWSWAGQPDILGDSLRIRVPQPENIVRQMFAVEDPDAVGSCDHPRIRLMVTRVEDGMAAKLYEGTAEAYDEDESYLCYEWQNIPANYNPLHTLLPQIHMPAFDPSIRVALHMGDESWFELAPSIDTEFDFGHSYDLDVAKFLKLLDTCVNFT